MKRKRLANDNPDVSQTALREGDRRLLRLLQMDLAFASRPNGRFIKGEPQAVVELLNAPVEEIEDL